MNNKCDHKYAHNGMCKLIDPPAYEIECLICDHYLFVRKSFLDLTLLYKCNDFGKAHKIEPLKKGVVWCSVCGIINKKEIN